MVRLVARMDRLWLGARLAEAMRADPEIVAEWFRFLGPVDAEMADIAITDLQAEGQWRVPTPGIVAQRADEIAERNRIEPPPAHVMADPTPEELERARRWMPIIRAAVDTLSHRWDPRVLD
jgi:hypothetical protein